MSKRPWTKCSSAAAASTSSSSASRQRRLKRTSRPVPSSPHSGLQGLRHADEAFFPFQPAFQKCKTFVRVGGLIVYVVADWKVFRALCVQSSGTFWERLEV